jgi:hypothetical protein
MSMKATYKIKVFWDDITYSPFNHDATRIKLWAWGAPTRGLRALEGTSPDCPDVQTWGDALHELVCAANAIPTRIWPVYLQDRFSLTPGPNAPLIGYLWTQDPTVTLETLQTELDFFNAWHSGEVCEYIIKLLDEGEDDLGARVATGTGFLSNKHAIDAALLRLGDVAPVSGYDVIIEDLSLEKE